MEQVFASLSKRQTMLLLTSLAFGGSEAVNAYEHLLPDEEELLKNRAQALLQIPREKRVPILVQEIKRLVTLRRRQLASAEPKRLAELLKKERPAMIEVVLRALPMELANSVRAAIPNHPTIKLRRDVRPDILSIIRWKLEDALKRKSPQVGTFRFQDLLMLQQREVLSICDRMGARVLATAFAGLNDAERDALLQKMPPDQRSLASKAAEAGKAKRLSEDDSKTVLEMHGTLDNPSLGMRSAGAQRLARACIAQGQDFAQQMVQRHPGELGKVLHRWVRDEKNRPIKGDGGRLDIVEQMERLAQKGIIDRPMRLPPPVRPPAAAPAYPGKQAPSSSAAGPTPPRPRKPQSRVATDQRPAVARPQRAATMEGSQAKRIMRDGKPLPASDVATAKRVKPSPTFQEVPKRRTAAEAKSPVVKGSGRGPSGGSR